MSIETFTFSSITLEHSGIGIRVCVGRSGYPCWRSKWIARQGTAGRTFAFGFRGASAQKPIRLFGEDERIPAGVGDSGGVVDWTDQPYSDPRLSPRACTKPAGRFHRGATRSELVITAADDTDRCPGRSIPPCKRVGWRVEPCGANIPIAS